MGEKGSVDKIHVVCCLADLLTRFQIIKFTKSKLIWTITIAFPFGEIQSMVDAELGFLWGKVACIELVTRKETEAIFERSAETGFQVQLFSRNIQATLFFNCHMMKADTSELCRVGHLLAQVELIPHCVWMSDLATPTQGCDGRLSTSSGD